MKSYYYIGTKNCHKKLKILTWLLALIFLFPYFWLVLISFKTRTDLFDASSLLLFTPTLDNYKIAFIDKGFGRDLINSLILSIGSTILVLVLGIPAAYVFSRKKFKWRNDLIFFILTTRMAPPIVIALPIFYAYSYLGLFNTHIGIIIIHCGMNLSVTIWLLTNYFNKIPPSLDEASLIDGNNRWTALIQNVLPAARGGIYTAGLVAFILSWNEYFLVSILTATETRTLNVAIPGLVTPHGTYWGQVAAIGVVETIPIIIAVLFLRGQLDRGWLRKS